MGTMERSARGKFLMKEDGTFVPLLVPPEGVVTPPGAKLYSPGRDVGDPPIGPTRIGEWLMVDIRVAKKVRPKSRLHDLCRALSDAGACGVIESTLVVDLRDAAPADARFLADMRNWPR